MKEVIYRFNISADNGLSAVQISRCLPILYIILYILYNFIYYIFTLLQGPLQEALRGLLPLLQPRLAVVQGAAGEPAEQEQLLRGRGHLRGRAGVQLRGELAVVVTGECVGLAAVVARPHLRGDSESDRRRLGRSAAQAAPAHSRGEEEAGQKVMLKKQGRGMFFYHLGLLPNNLCSAYW